MVDPLAEQLASVDRRVAIGAGDERKNARPRLGVIECNRVHPLGRAIGDLLLPDDRRVNGRPVKIVLTQMYVDVERIGGAGHESVERVVLSDEEERVGRELRGDADDATTFLIDLETQAADIVDRKSTRLNSSHLGI